MKIQPPDARALTTPKELALIPALQAGSSTTIHVSKKASHALQDGQCRVLLANRTPVSPALIIGQRQIIPANQILNIPALADGMYTTTPADLIPSLLAVLAGLSQATHADPILLFLAQQVPIMTSADLDQTEHMVANPLPATLLGE